MLDIYQLSRMIASLTIGFVILYVGVLLNDFILKNTSIVMLLFVVIAVIIANKIGNKLWYGIGSFILFFIFSSQFTIFLGEPEEIQLITDSLVLQGIVALIVTLILDLIEK
ncbi:hypothetical protein DFR57_1253 [Saliterribacillus persicus]|uniref:Uncharacterized protein n=2 Tax=Saliterribacillus persicus TaxID=930114 RepID=A0A368X3I0_9BACI|nr:hypothetical protein DFR57_1253 [Saliterribacillus persicus]